MSPYLRTTSNLVRRGLLSAIVVAGGGVFGIWCYAKNTMLLKKYKKYIESTGRNGPIKPSLKLQDMVTEVNEYLVEKNLVNEYTNIDSIIVPGLSTLHIGTMGTYQGGVVGLPSFFEFQKKEEVERELATMLGNTSGEKVEEIYNAFLLSDEAKRYAIARELLLINSPQVYFDMIVPIFIPIIIVQITSIPNLQSEISKLPVMGRIIFYLALTFIGLTCWRSIHNRLQMRYEKKAEVKISKLGDDYIKGGLEYNTKAIERLPHSAILENQQSRVLKTFRDKIRSWFYLRELPLAQRVQFYNTVLTNKQEEME